MTGSEDVFSSVTYTASKAGLKHIRETRAATREYFAQLTMATGMPVLSSIRCVSYVVGTRDLRAVEVKAPQRRRSQLGYIGCISVGVAKGLKKNEMDQISSFKPGADVK